MSGGTMRESLAALVLSTLLWGTPLTGQSASRCPASTEGLVASGWQALREGAIEVGESRFSAARRECPTSTDAMVGAGFAALRGGRLASAESLFTVVTQLAPRYVDAWEGLAAIQYRRGELREAQRLWQQVLALDGGHAAARAALDQINPDWNRPPRPVIRRRAAGLELTTRVVGEHFEIWREDHWERFFIKGVNLGPALPGRFPAEAPTDSAIYARWLDQIAMMHANTVRVYTILPPGFYRALRAHNLRQPSRPVYLIHGVWMELPSDHDFANPAFTAGFQREIRDVVDLLHGAAELAPRPGHASGRFDADVSPWTIGYIIGREMEPFAAQAFDAMPHPPRSHAGTHLRVTDATATETWLVARCDDLLRYEEETYNALRPIAYTNWPTTDPIRHPTELPGREMARRLGRIFTAAEDPLQHDEDVVALDPSRVTPTARAVAGWFASYHVYPYYPDFMIHDPGYARAASSRGPSNYLGYLQDLRRAHRGLPVVIAEFGVPSSRGNAHLQPQGWHHGGLSEDEQARATVRLAQDIREAGMAGAIAFAWIDEWFKLSWIAADFMLPRERVPLWHNMLSPEQHFGILALRPGPASTPIPGGPIADWTRLAPVHVTPDSSVILRMGSDPGFVYLALQSTAWAGRPFDWDGHRFQIAIDTYRSDLGGFLLPETGVRSDVGFEFLLELGGPGRAQLRVLPEYNPYTPARFVERGATWGAHFRRPVHSAVRRDGIFDTLYVMSNAPRLLGDGRQVAAAGFNLGRLRYGRAAEHSLADWWFDEGHGVIQIRLPWGLLNVSDPSSRSVLADDHTPPLGNRWAGPIRIERTQGFRLAVISANPDGRVSWTLPRRTATGVLSMNDLSVWTWPTWDTPEWHEYLKPVHAALKHAWEDPQ